MKHTEQKHSELSYRAQVAIMAGGTILGIIVALIVIILIYFGDSLRYFF